MKGAVGKISSSSDDNVEATDETAEATNQISPPTSPKKGRRKKLNGKKYEQIEDLEEKAFQILLDLDMIQEHNWSRNTSEIKYHNLHRMKERRQETLDKPRQTAIFVW